ncbi:MAG: lysine--tRNA ligase [Spirochaetales bacterium]|nr:lysine--tRNA ligase [Spirochaetales bacterium]
MKEKGSHWADAIAERIIHTKGEKDRYVCASGITPSGTVHIGNFREIISVDLVVRALREKGKQVRFIYSWDDYDVFRKVPANMPNKEMLEGYLRKPIVVTPDPYGKEESYARKNEKEVESVLPVVGIFPEYIYQAQQYGGSVYAEYMKTALDKKGIIIGILNKHRSEPLPETWWPVSVFCGNCQKDTTRITSYDEAYTIGYECSSCNHSETLDIRKANNVKLFWRIDWPMRWKFEQVDFEPAGKEHHSSGGSFDTARVIAGEVYDYDPPVTFKYDFISIKGQGGKISSSLGNVLSLSDVLEIYQPEVVRYLFAGTRPDTEFAVSFDLDVIKIYEDYDRCERVYFEAETVSEKKKEKEKRIYELSQVNSVPGSFPLQVPFRHLCNLLQINNGNIDDCMASLDAGEGDVYDRLRTRAVCAWNWITTYAPDTFRFSLRPPDAEAIPLDSSQKEAVSALRKELASSFDSFDEKSLSEFFYTIAGNNDMDPKELYKTLYRVLIGKEMGPRLAAFILTIGKERIISLLEPY